MKKKLLLSFIVILAFVANLLAQDTIVGWTFPTATKADSLANVGLMINKNQAIHLKSDSMIMYITKTYASPPACAQAMGMSNGTIQEKGWYITLNSTGYQNLKLYSKQMACPMHSGPKYWKIQYKKGSGTWTDIPNGNVICALNWAKGVVSNLSLPAVCNDNSAIMLRWVMASDSNVAGATHGTTFVTDSSMSRIDDIYVLGNKIMAGFDTIVGWTFPTATKADSLANVGLIVNKTRSIHLKADSMIMIITKTYASPPACAQAMGLSNGTALEKGWYLTFNSTGFQNLKLYSKQMACPMHSGPKYWKIQYKTGSGSWTDVPNGNVTCALNWVKGVVNNLSLPALCENNSDVMLRWVMASDSNVSGASHGTAIVTDTSMSRIDDIYVIGQKMTGVNEPVFKDQIKVYPVPNDGLFFIQNPNKSEMISIYSVLGELVYQNNNPAMFVNTIDLRKLEKGVYIIKIKEINQTIIFKTIIK